VQVATAMTVGDALAAHKRDELGITADTEARPVQAALVSAVTFATGAALPLGVSWLLPESAILAGVTLATLAALVVLGATGAHAGGASRWRGAVRVTLWGAVAMLATAAVGWMFGTAL
jgi:VIT1/CCC1 family predicted Fe2+/Mn2+ transporter